jgi:hypothetical protein
MLSGNAMDPLDTLVVLLAWFTVWLTGLLVLVA